MHERAHSNPSRTRPSVAVLAVGAVIGLFSPVMGLSGCVKRTIGITSEPAGALVWLNDREIGRTPVEVEFLHYGDYDVRMELEGYEPLAEVGVARPPIWDSIPLDLAAELIPSKLESHLEWHFVMEAEMMDAVALVQRANAARFELGPEEVAD